MTKKPLGGGIAHRNPSCSESSLKTIEDLFSIVYFFKLAQSLAHIARKTFSVSSPFNWYRSWYRVFSNHFFFSKETTSVGSSCVAFFVLQNGMDLSLLN